MKKIYNISISDTDEVLGGFLFETEMLTEKQMFKVCIQTGKSFLNNNDCKEYQLEVSDESDEDFLFFITFRKCGRVIDYRIWDCTKEKVVKDTSDERYIKENLSYMKKLEQRLKETTNELIRSITEAELSRYQRRMQKYNI